VKKGATCLVSPWRATESESQRCRTGPFLPCKPYYLVGNTPSLFQSSGQTEQKSDRVLQNNKLSIIVYCDFAMMGLVGDMMDRVPRGSDGVEDAQRAEG
jgi:hypothetical protein